jgi:hypothetical protein
VLSVHSGASKPQSITRGAGGGADVGASDVVREGEPPIDEKTLKRFIQFARSHCFPRLEEQSAGRLVAKYVELRDKVGCVVLSGCGWLAGWCGVVDGLGVRQHEAKTPTQLSCCCPL